MEGLVTPMGLSLSFIKKYTKLDRGSIRSSPRNGIGYTSKKNMELTSLVTVTISSNIQFSLSGCTVNS